MARYHMTDDGPKECSAKIQCPLRKEAIERGEDPDTVPHFTSKKKANEAWANILAEKNKEQVHESLKKPVHSTVIVENLELDEVEKEYQEARLITGTRISGRIDPNSLNEESYKQFGFKRWDEQELTQYLSDSDLYSGESIRMVKKGTPDHPSPVYVSDQISEREMEKLPEIEKGVLNYYTTDAYRWIGDSLNSQEKYDNLVDDLDPDEIIDYDGNVLTDETIFTQREDGIYNVPDEEVRSKKMFHQVIDSMDTSLKRGIKKQRIVYRGVATELADSFDVNKTKKWLDENRRIGTVIENKGYLSVSYSLNTANNFGDISLPSIKDEHGEKNVTHIVYEMLTPDGVCVSSISDSKSEEEVVLPRDRRFVVVGRQLYRNIQPKHATLKHNYYIVQMVAVNEDLEILDGNNSVTPSLFGG